VRDENNADLPIWPKITLAVPASTIRFRLNGRIHLFKFVTTATLSRGQIPAARPQRFAFLDSSHQFIPLALAEFDLIRRPASQLLPGFSFCNVPAPFDQ
jgi:hypothetical protein